MNPLALSDIGSKIIDRVLPDPAQKQAATLELLKLQQAGEFKEIDAQLQVSLAQADINKVEAAGGFFKSGWRPGAGWVCVIGLGYQFLAQPLLTWMSSVRGWPIPPVLQIGDLMTLLFGMLGLGALRSKEKLEGKA